MLNRNIKVLKKSIFFIFYMVILVIVPSPSTALSASEPDVATRNATYVTNDSITLNGSVNGNNSSTRVWFEYGTTRSMNKTTPKESTGDDYDNFSIDIEDLREDTIYYFRAVAKNSEGTDYGNTFSFRTASDFNPFYYNNNYFDTNYDYYNYYNQPTNSKTLTAITESATRIQNNSAELNSLIMNGGNTSSSSWFEWGRTQALGFRTETMSVGFSPSVRHVHTLSGLTPNTTYYFRAVAENSAWRNVGSILSFRTAGITPGETIIIEEPAITPKTTVEKTPPIKSADPVETKTSSSVAPLGANVLNVLGVGFFPRNIIEWAVLVILTLILIMLTRQSFNGQETKKTEPEESHK